MLPRAPVALSSHSELSFSGQLRAATSTALRNREHHHRIQDPPGTCPTPSREQPPLGMRTRSQGETSLSNITLPGRPRHPARASCPRPHPGPGTDSSSSRRRSPGTSVFQPGLLRALPRELITLPPSRKQGVLPSRIDCKLTSSSRKRPILQRQADTHLTETEHMK